jgi:uncharacterized membrane protein
VEDSVVADLIVIGFEGKHRAAEVLSQVVGLNASWTIDLKDAVAVYRTDDGRLRVDESVQPTTKEGAAWGGILGGMIGALLLAPFTGGLSTAVAASTVGFGAVSGGVTGALIGGADAESWKEAYGISDDFVRQVGGMVQPGQSAVFVLARAYDPAQVVEKFTGYGGKVLRSTLPKDSEAKFQKLLASAGSAQATR